MFLIHTSSKKITKIEKPSSSEFSDFFRKASSAKKKQVFNDVVKEATKTQQAYVK